MVQRSKWVTVKWDLVKSQGYFSLSWRYGHPKWVNWHATVSYLCYKQFIFKFILRNHVTCGKFNIQFIAFQVNVVDHWGKAVKLRVCVKLSFIIVDLCLPRLTFDCFDVICCSILERCTAPWTFRGIASVRSVMTLITLHTCALKSW